MRVWVATAAVVAVARLATPTAHKNPVVALDLGSGLPPPVLVETSSVVKLAGRLPGVSPLVRKAAVTLPSVAGESKLEESVRIILAQMGGRPDQQGAPPGGRDGSSEQGHGGPADPNLGSHLKPNMGLYREDGLEALKNMSDDEEDEAPVEKLSPLQAAHPDSFIVVCEAGCRPSSDKIVYEVSKVAAAAAEIAKRRLETTAAPASDGSQEVATADNTVVCVAGCYNDEKKVPAQAPLAKPANKKAEAKPVEMPHQRIRLAAAGNQRLRIPSRMKRQLAKVTRPLEIGAVRPHAIGALGPETLAAVGSKPDKVAIAEAGPSPKAATSARPRRDLRDVRKSRKIMARKAVKSGRWVTTVVRAADETPPIAPATPPASRPALIRPSGDRAGSETAQSWQTTTATSQGDGEPSASETPATTWGYVIRLAP